ncbi:RNA 2',3'-cyclic phosphodiesterase [Rhodobacterales bacterium HKCCE2091]|nr:RNA 2',3'-cyclic phosphodiesterase [Rhodobacterales bacterium HKCCE2091]
MRAFLAIDLPDATTDAIEALQRALPIGRAVPPDNLHLTLAFIENLPPDLEEPVHDALSSLRSRPVPVAFGGLTSFGDPQKGALALDVLPDPALDDLQSRAEQRLRRAGLDLPRRRFRPHVTILRGRLTGDPLTRAMTRPAPDIPGFTATAVTLHESTLGPGGAVYTPLATYPLSE